MPIVQERLINLINITDKALNIGRLDKRIAKHAIDKFMDEIKPKLEALGVQGQQAIPIVQEFLVTHMNMIIENQISAEDFMTFREEQIHFKYNESKNRYNRQAQKRVRAKRKEHQAAQQEEVMYAEDFAAINNAFATIEHERKDEEVPSAPALEADPDYDPSARGEIIKDANVVGDKPIRGIGNKSIPGSNSKE